MASLFWSYTINSFEIYGHLSPQPQHRAVVETLENAVAPDIIISNLGGVQENL